VQMTLKLVQSKQNPEARTTGAVAANRNGSFSSPHPRAALPSPMDSTAAAPVVLVTNDDGIDATGLRFLVEQLVASQRFRLLVFAPDMSVFQTLVESRSLPRSCSLPFLQFPSSVACLVRTRTMR
jgi:hypothetical protein